jgi:hypothetical protein
MLAWLRDLTSRERRTMLACWGGWTLDGFDQQLYSYVVPTVIAVSGMSTGAAGTIGTITVVTSSFGGWFAGALSDRFGRVAALCVSADRQRGEPIDPRRGQRANPQAPARRGARACAGANRRAPAGVSQRQARSVSRVGST